MIIVLQNSKEVEINKNNCIYEHREKYSKNSHERNMDPLQVIQDQRKGFFVIDNWGSEEHLMIPVRSVLYVKESHLW